MRERSRGRPVGVLFTVDVSCHAVQFIESQSTRHINLLFLRQTPCGPGSSGGNSQIGGKMVGHRWSSMETNYCRDCPRSFAPPYDLIARACTRFFNLEHHLPQVWNT